MPLLPVRNLAERGILKDPSPYDIPPNAFTGGSNVRFEVGKARRAPIFRTISSTLSADPQFCVGYRPSTGFDAVYYAGQDGSLWRLAAGLSVDVTPAGRVLGSTPAAYNSTFLGDVLYINRPSHTPAAFLPAASQFVELPHWDSTWRCRSLRSYRDFLVALNVTKGAVENRSLIKWSDATLAGQAPGSWDETDITTLAGENLIAQFDSPLVDGCILREALMLYTETQVWSMTFSGDASDNGQNLFVFRPVFSEGGMIAPNCAVEVAGRHYVFGVNDIYVHDGTSKQSIANGRVRDWVFRNLNAKLGDRCFVTHMPKYNEVLFAFVSGDGERFFVSPTRCNRAAVYNYVSDTWAMVDLPNVAAGTLANANPALTGNSPTLTTIPGNSMGGTWYDLEDGYESHVMFCASPLSGGPSTSRILAYDNMDRGSLPYPYDAESNAPAFLERVGIDLDEVGADLATYKVCKRLLPQVAIYRDVPLNIQVGSSLTPSGNVQWGPVVSFNPNTQYKVDVMKGGRYLAVRFLVAQPADFEISGFDVDVVARGSR